MSSHYFCLIKARTYSVVSNYCSKAARTVAAGHQSKPQERITHTDGMDLEASLPNSHGHTDFQECVAHMNDLFAALERQALYPKRTEHSKRQMRLYKSTFILQATVTEARIMGWSRRKAAYQRSRNLYRSTLGINKEVISKLINSFDWNIWFCSYQADSCIAQQWAKAWDPSEVLVITGDSDLTVYKSIPRVALPVGKSRELNNMFEKKSILAVLDLPTDNHLLLAPIFGNNDCTIGVSSNASIGVSSFSNASTDDRDPPVTTLLIRRSALYCPTTAARAER
ncbi:hypothetical protein BGX33_003889 [Mortierella sp. NVP41]|nr:hypothetical protein BGX33_003889 [Mortierella sp. NVP41]